MEPIFDSEKFSLTRPLGGGPVERLVLFAIGCHGCVARRDPVCKPCGDTTGLHYTYFKTTTMDSCTPECVLYPQLRFFLWWAEGQMCGNIPDSHRDKAAGGPVPGIPYQFTM
jgi:hypothetical protein